MLGCFALKQRSVSLATWYECPKNPATEFSPERRPRDGKMDKTAFHVVHRYSRRDASARSSRSLQREDIARDIYGGLIRSQYLPGKLKFLSTEGAAGIFLTFGRVLYWKCELGNEITFERDSTGRLQLAVIADGFYRYAEACQELFGDENFSA